MFPSLLDRRREKRRKIIYSGADFDPLSVSAVVGWLRNGTTGLVSSVPNVLNGSNPATATTTPRQPTGNANLSMTFASGNNLEWPVSNFNTSRFGMLSWFKPSAGALAGYPFLWCLRQPAAVFSLTFTPSAKLIISVWTTAGVMRQAETTRVFVANTKYPVSFEYDGGQSAEVDKCYLNVGSGKEPLNFTGAGAMPAVVTAPTTSIFIGGFNAAGGQPYVGDCGRSTFALQGAGGISGGGLLSTADRDGLATVDPL